MDPFWKDFGLLLAIDCALLALVHVVRWLDWNASRGEVPVWFATLTVYFVISMHLLATFTIAGRLHTAEGAPLHVIASVVSGALPVTAALLMLCGSWIAAQTHSMHGWTKMTPYRPVESDWSRARAMKLRHDVVGALQQYRRYFEENPTCPRPLFEAARMLESERCYDQALHLLREILRRFGDEDIHWVEASYRLAHVLEIHYCDYDTSHYLLQKIIERCPATYHAYNARRLLNERDAGAFVAPARQAR